MNPTRLARLTRFLNRFGEASKFAWLPALIVSSASLYYAKQNFDRQVASSKPLIVVTDSNLESVSGKTTLHIGLKNVGGGKAADLHDKLYYYDKFEDRSIKIRDEDVGFDVYKEGGATLNLSFDGDFASTLFLLCYSYSDDYGTTYRNANPFRIGSKPLFGSVYPIVGVSHEDRLTLQHQLTCQ